MQIRHILQVVLLVLLLQSCTDRKKEWESNFARVNCALQKETGKLKADSISQVLPIIFEKDSLQRELLKTRAPYERQISVLTENIARAKSDYMVDYRKETDKHSAKYGHNSTPAYERKMAQLKKLLNERVSSFEMAIGQLKERMSADENFIITTKRIEELEYQSIVMGEKVVLQHQSVVDSLQSLLFSLDKEYKDLANKLSPTDQNDFELRRAAIQKNPCTVKLTTAN